MKDTFRFAGRLMFVIFLLLLLFTFAMFQGGFVSWFLFFATLPIFLYHLGLLCYPIKNWHVTRHLSRYVAGAGDRIEVTLRIKRSIPYPLYYCICEEVFPDSLRKVYDASEPHRFLGEPDKLNISRRIKRMVFPGFKRNIELSYIIDQIPRGEHHLQAIRIRTGDVFGIVTKEHVFYVDDRLVAMPNGRPVKMTETISSYAQGSTSTHSAHLKSTNVATGIREYVPGDKFSWIDWKQTAKKNTVITKQFEQEKSTSALLVLDASYYKEMNAFAFEMGIELTLSLLEKVQKQTANAGFMSIGADTMYFPLHQDPSKKDWIRRHLTSIQPGESVPFSVQLQENMMQIPAGANMFLVTTHLDDQFRDAIKRIRQRVKNLVIVLIQASAMISADEENMMRQLRSEGVVINVLTENELARKVIEVTTV